MVRPRRVAERLNTPCENGDAVRVRCGLELKSSGRVAQRQTLGQNFDQTTWLIDRLKKYRAHLIE